MPKLGELSPLLGTLALRNKAASKFEKKYGFFPSDANMRGYGFAAQHWMYDGVPYASFTRQHKAGKTVAYFVRGEYAYTVEVPLEGGYYTSA